LQSAFALFNNRELNGSGYVRGDESCRIGYLQEVSAIVLEGQPSSEWKHIPVMCDEVVSFLAPEAGSTCLDVTLGLGGHASALLPAMGDGIYVGLDRDSDALSLARTRLEAATDVARLVLRQACFSDVGDVLAAADVDSVDMVLADLGVSSMQLDNRARGFSYRDDDAALDMRMEPHRGDGVATRLETTDAKALAVVLSRFGEVQNAMKLAYVILDAEPKTVGDLRKTLEPFSKGEARKKLVARVFQALRI